MEATNENMSKRKKEVLSRGFNFVTLTREEVEEARPDYHRFAQPEGYQTEEELKYFKSDENRELFRTTLFKG